METKHVVESEESRVVGRVLNKLNTLFTVIRDKLNELEEGTQLMDFGWWCVTEGKEAFLASLTPLAQKFLSTRRVKVINETTLTVNLDASPLLPFDGAQIEKKPMNGLGCVLIEKRADGLYVGGCKVVLYLSEQQKDGKMIRGHELREELTGKPVLHPNILDALIDNPYMFPEDWKGRAVFFWAVIYRDLNGNLYVRYACFGGGAWARRYSFLGNGWNSNYPAALAS